MAECRYKGWCRIEYDTDFDVCYPCIGDCGETCAEYEPMPDVKALLELADEMDAYSGHFSTGLQECTVQAWAVAIRDALGVSK